MKRNLIAQFLLSRTLVYSTAAFALVFTWRTMSIERNPLRVTGTDIHKASLSEAAPPPGLRSVMRDVAPRDTAIVYADYLCVACASLFEMLDTSSVAQRWMVVWRYIPKAANIYSTQAALAGLCAQAIGGFSAVSRQLYADPKTARSFFVGDERMVAAASQATKIGQCVRSMPAQAALASDRADARRLNVRKTPTIWMRGMRYDGLPADLLKEFR